VPSTSTVGVTVVPDGVVTWTATVAATGVPSSSKQATPISQTSPTSRVTLASVVAWTLTAPPRTGTAPGTCP
jgi:hypothetical protein